MPFNYKGRQYIIEDEGVAALLADIVNDIEEMQKPELPDLYPL